MVWDTCGVFLGMWHAVCVVWCSVVYAVLDVVYVYCAAVCV